MAKVRPYYADGGLSARHYDLVTAADPSTAHDLELYAALAPPGGRILELGAGTGRLTMGLARLGFEVAGVDLAPAMLARAEARLAELSPEAAARVTLRRGDMTALDLKRAFDLVICPFFTLAHVPAGAAWRNTFASAARHLPAGGLAAFHLPRAELMERPMAVDPTRPVFDAPLPEGGRLRLHLTSRDFRAPPGRLEQVIEYVVLDARGAVRARSAERLTYYMADPARLAEPAGLHLDQPPMPLGETGDVWVFRKR